VIRNKWAAAVWVMLIASLSTFRYGITPVSIIIIIAAGAIAFGIYAGYEAIFKKDEPKEEAQEAPQAPESKTPEPKAPEPIPSQPPPPVLPGAITAEPLPVPPIPLEKPRSRPAQPPTPPKKEESKDSVRELIETIVFVVVLVLMLKTFLAEAFVIPTGSMADTLLGYHHKVVCQKCRYTNLVNASSEAERPWTPVISCQCENCGWVQDLPFPLPMPKRGP